MLIGCSEVVRVMVQMVLEVVSRRHVVGSKGQKVAELVDARVGVGRTF